MTHTSPTEIEEQIKEFYINCNNGYYRSFEDGGEQARTDLTALINQSQLELLERIETSINQHTVPEGKDLLTKSYVLNTLIFERSALQSERSGEVKTL